MPTDPETSEAVQPSGDTGERLDRVESKLDALANAVSKLIPGSHGEAQQRTEERLDRPTSVEEQVRAELARAREEEAAATRAEKDKAAGESVQERLARLEEKPPAPPRVRRTVMLGWGDGRQ